MAKKQENRTKEIAMDMQNIIRLVKPSIALVASFDSQKQLSAFGSGFIFGAKNILVTCNHVIKDAAATMLKFSKSTPIDSKVVLRDDEHDLALLKFEDVAREPIPIGSEEVIEGMPILFSGYPSGSEDLTTHQGIISAITTDVTGIMSYLIGGTVNSGNSGCPLLNMDGKVIGVINAKRRYQNAFLEQVESMPLGALSLHGIDIVKIYQALTCNLQLGVGYAVPAKYIPEHKDKTP
jgi:S1-C subfamily serine protease